MSRVMLGAGVVTLAAMGCTVAGPDAGTSGSGGNTAANAQGSGAGTSASGGQGASGGSGPGGNATCAVPIVDTSTSRPVDLMPSGSLAAYASRLPCIQDPNLVALLESEDTMFYDATSIVPGYQDSYGNGLDFPVGMRPNTIQSSLIDLAVPGGHAQLFEEKGVFHFPFGNPLDVSSGDAVVVDFWHVPRGEGGSLLPVVWWWYEPSNWTHRIRWTFPVGTVFGELMFIVGDQGTLFPFEIRTRSRQLDRWVVDAHRPFPEASDLAAALEGIPGTEVLVAHLTDGETLQAASLSASHFSEAFPTANGAEDVLPSLDDHGVIEGLLMESAFVSAKGKAWKSNGSLTAYAPTTAAAFSIVPRNYNAGLVPVTDESCGRCHEDAGRPFKDYYFNVLAYGELWGEDENFTWHPFEASAFVDGSGNVVSFSDDNRVMRSDFLAGGVLELFDQSQHPASVYNEIDRPWRNYVHQ